MIITQLSRRTAENDIDWNKKHLTFIPVDDCVFTWNETARSGVLYYSLDDGSTWTELETGESTPTVLARTKILWRGDLRPTIANDDTGGIGTFSATANYYAYGNVMSLLYEDDFYDKQLNTDSEFGYAFRRLFYNDTHILSAPELPATTLTSYCYSNMFRGCTSLATASELPATILAPSCYISMFMGCTSLVNIPSILPATTLSAHCYDGMFYGCTSLVTAPELPATILAPGCYISMFMGCTSLVNIPSILPATTLQKWCYYQMFRSCTKITTAPELPATTLANQCYYMMFNGCTSLTIAPELPATTLAASCYQGMFYNCSYLRIAPELPATTLAELCYRYMFYGCHRLNKAPELPATTLANECYYRMFMGCTSLVTAPELPATTLVSACYYQMFFGCTALVTAPELPATTLAPSCYGGMFGNCTKLSYIKCLATNISASSCLNAWVTNVAPSGTFVKNVDMGDWLTGESGIPSGWTVEQACDYEYLTFIADVNTSFTWNETASAGTLYYSLDNGSTWTELETGESTPTIPAQSKVLWKGDLRPSEQGIGTFSSTGNYHCYGNVMSLLYEDDFHDTQLEDEYAFYRLFYNDTHIISAPLLPATSLTAHCYEEMFYGCTMLSEFPELPSKTLAVSCYKSMFRGCTKPTEAPILPARILVQSCYEEMFYGCTMLKYVKCLATDISATNCTYNWLNNVCYIGTFVGIPEWTRGASGIPDAWDIVDGWEYEYLTFVPIEDASFGWRNDSPLGGPIEYSIDNGVTWTTIGEGESTPIVQRGNKIIWRGNKLPRQNTTNGGIGIFSSTGHYDAYGNTMSLLYLDDFYGKRIDVSAYSFVFFNLFRSDTNIVTAPLLPATDLSTYCYGAMFRGCNCLKHPPQLPATVTTKESCYTQMFYECKNLRTSPVLPAITLIYNCYNSMLYGCNKLNYVKCLATQGIGANGTTNYWLKIVSSTGTFIKTNGVDDWPTSGSGIPRGWAIKTSKEHEYLTFIPVDDCTFTWRNGWSAIGTLEYSLDDGQTWTIIEINGTVNVASGNSIMWRGNLTVEYEWGGIGTFDGTVGFHAQGNIMSLLYGDDFYGKQFDIKVHPYIFYNLFSGSHILTSPELPATTLSQGCYNSMFYNCTDLTTTPELPATILISQCYASMFYGCTSLTVAPELQATTLASGCYNSMFYNCTALATAPELPATTLADSCYCCMFSGCTSLTIAPELPATTLAVSCYLWMFYGCTSLTTAPELPATILADSCYNRMFSGCTSLDYIKCLATDISAPNCIDNWTNNTSQSGIFVKAEGMEEWSTGASGIPTGWTVIDGEEREYLTFMPIEDAVFTWSKRAKSGDLEYSIDNGVTWAVIGNNESTPTIVAGNRVMWRGNMTQSIISLITGGCGTFSSTGYYHAFGSTQSLLYKDDFYHTTTKAQYAFSRLFYNDTHILSAPLLPATTMHIRCYQEMFRGCTKLKRAQKILPATTLKSYCYSNMFNGCTHLKKAPVLPAPTLAQSCYDSMFENCYNLEYIKCLATDISATYSTYHWVTGVISTGLFVKADGMENWGTGAAGVPTRFATINNTQE